MRWLKELQDERDDRVKRRFQETDDDASVQTTSSATASTQGSSCEENSSSEEDSSNGEESSNDEEERQEEEADIFYNTRQQYRDEVRAYNRLNTLQGDCIPRFLDSVIYNPPDMPADLAAEFFQIPGILIEYIHSFSLSLLTFCIPNNPDVWRSIVEEARLVAKKVNAAGVVQNDCQPRNFLVSSAIGGAAPYRVWMIDFASSEVADDYKDAESVRDQNGFKRLIHRRGNHGAMPALMNVGIKRETGLDLGIKPWPECAFTDGECSCFE